MRNGNSQDNGQLIVTSDSSAPPSGRVTAGGDREMSICTESFTNLDSPANRPPEISETTQQRISTSGEAEQPHPSPDGAKSSVSGGGIRTNDYSPRDMKKPGSVTDPPSPMVMADLQSQREYYSEQETKSNSKESRIGRELRDENSSERVERVRHAGFPSNLTAYRVVDGAPRPPGRFLSFVRVEGDKDTAIEPPSNIFGDLTPKLRSNLINFWRTFAEHRVSLTTILFQPLVIAVLALFTFLAFLPADRPYEKAMGALSLLAGAAVVVIESSIAASDCRWTIMIVLCLWSRYAAILLWCVGLLMQDTDHYGEAPGRTKELLLVNRVSFIVIAAMLAERTRLSERHLQAYVTQVVSALRKTDARWRHYTATHQAATKAAVTAAAISQGTPSPLRGSTIAEDQGAEEDLTKTFVFLPGEFNREVVVHQSPPLISAAGVGDGSQQPAAGSLGASAGASAPRSANSSPKLHHIFRRVINSIINNENRQRARMAAWETPEGSMQFLPNSPNAFAIYLPTFIVGLFSAIIWFNYHLQNDTSSSLGVVCLWFIVPLCGMAIQFVAQLFEKELISLREGSECAGPHHNKEFKGTTYPIVSRNSQRLHSETPPPGTTRVPLQWPRRFSSLSANMSPVRSQRYIPLSYNMGVLANETSGCTNRGNSYEIYGSDLFGRYVKDTDASHTSISGSEYSAKDGNQGGSFNLEKKDESRLVNVRAYPLDSDRIFDTPSDGSTLVPVSSITSTISLIDLCPLLLAPREPGWSRESSYQDLLGRPLLAHTLSRVLPSLLHNDRFTSPQRTRIIVPTLLLSNELIVVAVNRPFCRLLHIDDPMCLLGRTLEPLLEWLDVDNIGDILSVVKDTYKGSFDGTKGEKDQESKSVDKKTGAAAVRRILFRGRGALTVARNKLPKDNADHFISLPPSELQFAMVLDVWHFNAEDHHCDTPHSAREYDPHHMNTSDGSLVIQNNYGGSQLRFPASLFHKPHSDTDAAPEESFGCDRRNSPIPPLIVLRQSYHHATMQCASIPLCLVQADGAVILWNDALAAASGISAFEVLGDQLYRFFSPGTFRGGLHKRKENKTEKLPPANLPFFAFGLIGPLETSAEERREAFCSMARFGNPGAPSSPRGHILCHFSFLSPQDIIKLEVQLGVPAAGNGGHLLRFLQRSIKEFKMQKKRSEKEKTPQSTSRLPPSASESAASGDVDSLEVSQRTGTLAEQLVERISAAVKLAAQNADSAQLLNAESTSATPAICSCESPGSEVGRAPSALNDFDQRNSTSQHLSTSPVDLVRVAGSALPEASSPWALLVSNDPQGCPSVEIATSVKEEFTLGRSSKCSVCISDSWVSGVQFGISRRVVKAKKGKKGTRMRIMLTDYSANGTYVNVMKVGNGRCTELKENDVITFRLGGNSFFLGFRFQLIPQRVENETASITSGSSPQRASEADGGRRREDDQKTPVGAVAIPVTPGAEARGTANTLAPGAISGGAVSAGGMGGDAGGAESAQAVAEFRIGEELLGKGGNAEVYFGLNVTNGFLMAIKRVPLPKDEVGLRQYKALQEEIDFLTKYRHVNIVQYYGSNKSEGHLNIFLEFVPGGSLRHLLDQFRPMNPGVILIYLRQVLEGLHYLHSQCIVHSDIKSANILVSDKGVVKLTDFGTAKPIQPHAPEGEVVEHEGERATGDGAPSGDSNPDAFMAVGTLLWMAPEILRGETGPTIASDMWSLGCVLLEMMTGELPWAEYEFENQEQIVNLLKYTTEPPELPIITPANDNPQFLLVRSIADMCLHLDPDARPTTQTLIKILEENGIHYQPLQALAPTKGITT